MTLSDLDRDGAIREALEAVGGDSRADFLRKTAVGGAALVGAVAAAPTAGAATSPRDVAILNYALMLEYLQAAFYTEAEREGALRGKAAQAVGVVGPVERAHVSAFRKALGSAAAKRPTFNFQGTTEDQKRFLETAVAFEDLAVAAYKDQAPRIRAPAILAVAVSIHSVEARHAAWMRRLVGILPAASPFDDGIDRAEAFRIVDATGFVTTSATTRAKGKPRFTG
ncbi:MAG: ferritin-like domain-containing protein [Gaiellaceae bacterium]